MEGGSPPTVRSMRDSSDYVLVPNSSRQTPYRIDGADNSHYIRIRQPGPDIIVLVPPGSSSADHRDFIESSMRSTARSAVADRSSDTLLKVLLFIAIPALFVASAVFLGDSFAGPSIVPDFADVLQAALIAAVVAYAFLLFLPRVGLAYSLFNTRYPSKPEYLLRQMRDDLGVRYLTEKVLSGDQSLVTLRRVILDRPSEVPEGIWSTLWILAGGEDLYPAAIRRLHRQAKDFEDEIVDSLEGPFEAEYTVTLEDVESGRSGGDPDGEVPIEGTPRNAHRADESPVSES